MEKASLALDPTGPLPVELEWLDLEDQRSMVIMTNVSFNETKRERETERERKRHASIHHLRLVSLDTRISFFFPLISSPEDHS